jgi:hypothetical protein
MEFAFVLRELWGRKRWLAAGVVVSAICAVLAVCQVSLSPPGLVKRSLQYSSASVQAYIDTPDSFVGDVGANIAPGTERATVFANLMASPGAMDVVGHYAGIAGDEIWAAGPVDPNEQRVVVEPTATKRSYQIAGESLPYRIEFLADPSLPMISIYTEAPTTAQALALANASVTALSAYVRQQQTQQRIPAASRVAVREIGAASGGVVNGGITEKLAGIVFVAVFIAWCVLMMALARLARNWRLILAPRRRAPAPADARHPHPPGGRVPVLVKPGVSSSNAAQPK